MLIFKRSAMAKSMAILLVTLLATCLPAGGSWAQMEVAATIPEAPVRDIKQTLPESGNVTVNFKDVDIKTVLHYLSEVSGVDIVPSPGVDAKVTMRLRDKPWVTALDIVTRNYGYTYSSDDEKGIIRVMPRGQLQLEETITEVIPLDHIMREIRLAKTSEEDSTVEVEETEKSIEQLLGAIRSMLDSGRGENVIFISSVNSVVVTAIPARIAKIKAMVTEIDKKSPQIILDVKVVEVLLDKDEKFGIDWNAVISVAGAKRPITFPFTSGGQLIGIAGEIQDQFLPKYGAQGLDDPNRFPYLDTTLMDPTAAATPSSVFSFGTLDFSTFTATLSLLDNRKDTEVLSSPRITTLNNQKATIKVIQKIMLQKAIQSTDTSTTVTVEYETPEEAREVGVKLTVVPHVNSEGDISVNLLAEVSNNEGFSVLTLPTGAVGNTTELTFNSREANTIIRVKDKETIFIGGLIRKDVLITENKLPILGDLLGGIPGVGGLFKYDAEKVERTEVVFFVTVHVIDSGAESIADSRTMKEFKRYFAKDAQYGSPGTFAKGAEGAAQNAAAKEEPRPPIIKQGVLSSSTTQVKVPTMPAEAVAPKKQNNPFLDFRKKK
ncbi:MAG: hypothetical protein P9L88_03560 [Candidatus Tantalella remota]|nr:hypothetical protein [Candidatus Tantalella remota]